MSKVQMLRASVTQRLTAAAEEIFVLFERSIAEYEEELSRSKEENERQRKLLDAVFNPQLQLHRADVQHLLESKEEVPPEQQGRSSSLHQEDPEPPHIKEEQEELLTNQEGEQLQGLVGVDIPSSPVSMKSLKHTEWNREAEPVASSSSEQMETEADGEDCGGPEPARNSHLYRHLQPDTDDKILNSSETDVSDGEWTETREPQIWSDLNSLKNKEIFLNDMKFNTGNNSFICSQCDKKFDSDESLQRHVTLSQHTGMTSFSCPLCNETFTHKIYLTIHMGDHAEEKQFSCHICEKRFTWRIQLRRHKCVGKSSQLNGGETKPVRNSVRISELRCGDGQNLFSSFSCPECKKNFATFHALKRHERAHSEKKLSCPFCDKAIFCRSHLIPHIAMHTGERPYSCRYCYRSFTWPYQVKNHKCSRDKYYKLYKSRIKEKRAAALQGLEEADINQFTVTPVLVKSEDDEEKPQSSQLHPSPPASSSAEQMETEADEEDCEGLEPDPDRHLQPDTADKTPEYGRNGDDGMKNKEPQSDLNCLKSKRVPVSDRRDYSYKREKLYGCSVCGKKSASENGLKQHMKRHFMKEISCSDCGDIFSSYSELKRHKYDKHPELEVEISDDEVPEEPVKDKRPFSCPECGRRFVTQAAVEMHMRTYLEGKKFRCQFCGAAFCHDVDLRQHSQYHRADKPFRCTQCDKRFAYRARLSYHMRSHSTERLSDCPMCTRKFKSNKDVLVHLRTHAGNHRPFICPFCRAVYFNKGKWIQHMKTYVGRKPADQFLPKESE
ncbi:oocyte zinc finger protein XlCOF6-like isoform X3 [Thunnus albacares]|uniref:oocyte zinc finger protein XlCOF6-like isoform X3 n=1 Tax=Thunnus albacares TaxID=8236 RepID=UPI001CF607E7|nr:oocyte zinc finger protein XlCOF6-like isoform X3 [Thunnus albacares]